MPRTAAKRKEIPEFTKELDLDELIVVDKREKGGDVVYVAEAAEKPKECISCHLTGRFRVHDKIESRINDLPRFGKRTGILLTRNRYRCTFCGYYVSDDFSCISGRMTVRLREAIKKETLYFPFSVLAEKYGVSDTLVNNLFVEMKSQCAAKYKPETPKVIGLSRLPMHRGKTTYTAVIDVGLKDGTIVEMSNAISEEGAKACLERLSDHGRCLRVVSDLWDPYYRAIYDTFGPDADVVVDKHYVLQALKSSFDEIRVKLQKKYTAKKMSRNYSRSHFLMQSDFYSLDRQREQHLNQLLEECPEFRAPYELKEAFIGIYDADNSHTATSQYSEWKEECRSLGIEGYYPFIDLVDRWEKEVFRYFDVPDYYRRIFNSIEKVQAIDREGYRYKYDVLRAKALYRNMFTINRNLKVDFDQFD